MTTYEHSLGGGKEEGIRHRRTIRSEIEEDASSSSSLSNYTHVDRLLPQTNSLREALLAKLKEAREQINVDEVAVNRMYEGNLKIFSENLKIYMAIMAVGVTGGYITKERAQLDVLLLMFALIFILGNGVGVWFVYSKLRKLQWKLDDLKRRRDDLRKSVLNFQKELDTNTGAMAEKVQEIIDSLKVDVFFKDVHMLDIRTTCACIIIYLGMTLICSYLYHTVKQNFTISGKHP